MDWYKGLVQPGNYSIIPVKLTDVELFQKLLKEGVLKIKL